MAQLAAAARPAGTATIGAAELDNAARAAWRHHRSGQRRHARRAEISAIGAVRIAVARRAAHRRGALFRRGRASRCDHICEGGIYDHLGGGFSRYSVDERWLVPHFEKMLYDNAQLLELSGDCAPARRQDALSHARVRNGGLAPARDDDRGGRVLGVARCRLRGRGGQILRLVLRRRDQTARHRGRRILRPPLRRDAGRQFRRPHDPQPPQALASRGASGGRRGAPRGVARKASRRARHTGAARASTTRCWPTGTG